MSNAVSSYIQYLQDVLGVRQVILPTAPDAVPPTLTDLATTRTGHWPEPAEFDLLIVHRGEGLFHGASAELWEKMKSAMNIGGLRVLEIESRTEDTEGALLMLLETYPATVSLMLTREPVRMEGFRTLGLSKVFESFSPSMLVQQAELKRPSWRDLQLVMKELGVLK